jgi:predicted thioesterase
MEPSEFIQPGLEKEETFTVEEQHTAAHVGSGTVRVLATPWMIAFMEITARKLLDEHLPDGYSSVGVLVNVRHLAPASLGSQVIANARVQDVDGNRVTLAVEVREGDKRIGAGLHERHVIEVERFLKRVGGP